MKKIAHHDPVEIFAPSDSRFSFLKSPYAAHLTHSAVDIYYDSFGSPALSPVDGEVMDIRTFDTPTPFKDKDFAEYIIAIRQGQHVIKILHVKPEISKGDNVSKGDRIGTLIYNGYYTFWNDPAMHIEVRHPDDYVRASNSMRLTPDMEWSELPSRKILEIECRVEEIKKNYSRLSAKYDRCGNVMGFAMDGGFIDGYISQEGGFFGIVKRQDFSHPGISVMEVMKDGSSVNCAGIAFCLSFKEPWIKLVPRKYGDKLFNEGDNIFIKFCIR